MKERDFAVRFLLPTLFVWAALIVSAFVPITNFAPVLRWFLVDLDAPMRWEPFVTWSVLNLIVIGWQVRRARRSRPIN